MAHNRSSDVVVGPHGNFILVKVPAERWGNTRDYQMQGRPAKGTDSRWHLVPVTAVKLSSEGELFRAFLNGHERRLVNHPCMSTVGLVWAGRYWCYSLRFARGVKWTNMVNTLLTVDQDLEVSGLKIITPGHWSEVYIPG